MSLIPFRTNIRAAIADPVLQAALDANYERRNQARLEAFAALTRAEELCQRAHAIRAEVVNHLESYVSQFTEKAQANGILVHPAQDADEAVKLVLEIARQKGAKLIAKSKSMMSEEINLNRGLEQVGINVVETDLGEYIVQLRQERPGHIITPAVHLRRQEVGQTFHEKLGVPYTEDIPSMTDVARKNLRETFLRAEIGISGVNFGVADTGMICLLTNEGNGRMVTTLPPVHIALMGLERLVPNLDDLAVLLAVLPRASTGQKLTVYTSLINTPRRPGEADGSPERHLILIDNGRRAIQQSPLAEVLYCVRCGSCLNVCPVFREIGGHVSYQGLHGAEGCYAGPVGAVLSPALWGQQEFGHLARASSLCGACKEACPVGVDLPELLLRVRAGGMDMLKRTGELGSNTGGSETAAQHEAEQASKTLKWGLSIFTWFASRPRSFTLAQKLLAWGGRLFSPRHNWMRLPAITGWGASKDFPRPAALTFQQRWVKRQRDVKAPEPLNDQAGYDATRRTDYQPPHRSPDDENREPSQTANRQSLIAQFTEELTSLSGSVILCKENELTERILSTLTRREITSLLAWEAEHLPPGLLATLKAAGIALLHRPDPSISAGLTGAVAACAETGSILLPGRHGQPLSASLLPGLHIAVLRAADIHQNLVSLLNSDQVREASSSVIITGPSRTADIEMTLTLGMHGPQEVLVLIYEESRKAGN